MLVSTMKVFSNWTFQNPNPPEYVCFIATFRNEEGVFRFSDDTTFTKTGGEWGSDGVTW